MLEPGRIRDNTRCLAAAIAIVASLALGAPAQAQEPAGPPSIAAENAQPGTAGWFVARPRQSRIAGYAGAPSYRPGESVALFVDSHGAPFGLRVYRLGSYGGRGGRLVLVRRRVPNAPQPRPSIADDRPGGAKLLLTGWHASVRFGVPRSWASGIYLVRLVRLDRGGGQSYATFVVRAASAAPIVVVVSTSTWQAYNTWGGLSLYRDLRLPRSEWARQALVAHVVTSRRPYVQGYGAGDVFRSDRPLLEWLEGRGTPVSYATDRDALRGRVGGRRTRLVILSGHPEYHSRAERDHYRRLVGRGVSLAILGGNSFVWQARYRFHAQHMEVWRRRVLDPLGGPEATVRWPSVGWRPDGLTGVRPVLGAPGRLRVEGAGAWPWRGSGVRTGVSLGRPLGAERDGRPPGTLTPPGLRVLARAPVARHPDRSVTWTISTRRSGAFVFSASELGFSWRLAYPSGTTKAWIDRPSPPGAKRDYPPASRASRPVQRLVANLIARAVAGR